MTIDDNDNGGQRNVDGARLSRETGIIVSLPPLEYKSTLIGGQRKTVIAIPKATTASVRKTARKIRQLRCILIKTNPEINTAPTFVISAKK